MNSKQEMLALGVRGARKKRDLMMRRNKNGVKLGNIHVLNILGQQDDVVEAHLRQFKQSFNK